MLQINFHTYHPVFAPTKKKIEERVSNYRKVKPQGLFFKLSKLCFFLQKPDNVNAGDLWNVCAAEGHGSPSL